jgi:hypothetical protein
MSRLHLRHIKNRLEDTYKDLIDMCDIKDKSLDDRNKRYLTRAFAAYAIQSLGGIEPKTASLSVVDGYDDNGIDALYYDEKDKILWLVQSKWISKADGEPDTGEVSKFTKGIRDLIDLKLERFNEKIKAKENEIINALNNPLIKINVVLAYTGQDQLSIHNERLFSDLIKELNDTSELAIYRKFSLKSAHKALVTTLDGNPVNVDLVLTNWGKFEEPYPSVYGTIGACDLANIWKDNRNRIFSENIRDFIGFSDVNEDIIDTITENPENFYYFNNGVTALCKSISKKPLGGNDRNIGYFIAEDFKIVNGAQTVGSLGVYSDKNKENLEKIRVFIKLISLENCPEDFGVQITKATNTQNRIDKKDFVSLDPEQERIKIELALENITYHYKRSDIIIPTDDKNCTVEEATIALACFNNDVSLAVQAKREIGKLWSDIAKEPYTIMFNHKVKGYVIWRAILVLRKVNEVLKEKELKSESRDKSHYIHSNRLILHLVFKGINKDNLYTPHFKFENYVSNFLAAEVDKISEKVKLELDELYPTSLVHQTYRNFSKCREFVKTFKA